MNPDDPTAPSDGLPPSDDHDPVLSAAGARLRQQVPGVSAPAVEAAVWRRRARRVGVLAGASLVVVALLGALLVQERRSDSGDGGDVAGERPGAPSEASVDRLLASLDAQPVDPTRVRLVSTVSTFADCDALIGDLRSVGAAHVGSRGFGGYGDVIPFPRGVADAEGASDFLSPVAGNLAYTGGDDAGTTLGTNVQVSGVDELDLVKAVGSLIYDLDGKGNLRITDAKTLAVVSTVATVPADLLPDPTGERASDGGWAGVSELLVADGRAVVFGSETEVSEPVEGDPSATQASTSYLTVAFVDVSDPAAPTLTDRVRVEGSLVSARLVGGEVRLVTTANMADLGFVMPTTPNSVAKALDMNRRSVASSTAPDWIPDWQREGSDPRPLVPCERVHVPDTFAGVAMTSMVTFPLGVERFEPSATSILAPATTLYAGLDTVAISSEVWVDPVDRDRLDFDTWQTAIHEFRFADAAGDAEVPADTAPPTYAGSGIVDGSTVGQFAFGEIADSLAVVTTEGTPWQQDPEVAVDLTVLTADGNGGLAKTGTVEDLADGMGAVVAVRFVEGRVLISTGLFGREVHVIDVTDPAAPRRAGTVALPGEVGYFHPLPENRALLVGSRYDEVGEGPSRRGRSWVQAHLLDVGDPDAPVIVASWERPWVADNTAYDHHAFTFWPDRELALWGLYRTDSEAGTQLNEAVVLQAGEALAEVALPVASKPNEVPPPCPAVEITDPDARDMVGPDGVVLRCDDVDRATVEWPRYRCYRVDAGMVARFAPGQEELASFHLCSPASPPVVRRVLVVAGTPILLTDQTLEALDPATFQRTAVAYHPGSDANVW
jgi:hypothetical protein